MKSYISKTREFLATNIREAFELFGDEPFSRNPINDVVYIYSNEHKLYWRVNQRGYTSNKKEAGIYTRKLAERILRYSGAEKELRIINA